MRWRTGLALIDDLNSCDTRVANADVLRIFRPTDRARLA